MKEEISNVCQEKHCSSYNETYPNNCTYGPTEHCPFHFAAQTAAQTRMEIGLALELIDKEEHMIDPYVARVRAATETLKRGESL